MRGTPGGATGATDYEVYPEYTLDSDSVESRDWDVMTFRNRVYTDKLMIDST